jgi:hypothetical protein
MLIKGTQAPRSKARIAPQSVSSKPSQRPVPPSLQQNKSFQLATQTVAACVGGDTSDSLIP